MNIKKEKIRTIGANVMLSGQQNVESDIILPEYYGNINKILKCSIKPYCESVTTNSDKVSISGYARVSVLYTDDNSEIYNFETDVRYTKIFQIDNTESTDCVKAEQTVLSCNYRAAGPKRIEIKGVLQVALKIARITDAEYISEIADESIIVRNKTIRCYETSCKVNRDFTCHEEFNTESDVISNAIIRKHGSLNILETKIIKDKTYIKGEVDFSVSYTDKQNKIRLLNGTIPVTEVIDTYNSDENDDCIIEYKSFSVNVFVRDGNMNNSVFDVSGSANIVIRTGHYSDISLIDDIYSLNNEAIGKKNEIEIIKNRESIQLNHELIYETESIDNETFEICDVFADDIKAIVNKNDSGYEILISGNINALVRKNDNTFLLISRTISSVKEMDVNDYNDFEVLDSELLSINALQVHDGKIRFSVNVSILCENNTTCKEKVLTDIEVNNRCDSKENRGIVMYYANADEDVWSIAKQNRTTVEFIKKINGIDGDALEHDMLLIFPNI